MYCSKARGLSEILPTAHLLRIGAAAKGMLLPHVPCPSNGLIKEKHLAD